MSKKTKILVGAVIAVLAIIVIIAVAGNSSSKKKIIGSWQISATSIENSNIDNYPENGYLTFLEDGTGYFDGNIDDVFYYTINDKTITMDCNDWLITYTYDFEISGDELTLKYVGDNPIYYNKIDESEITTVEQTTKNQIFKTFEGEKRWSN